MKIKKGYYLKETDGQCIVKCDCASFNEAIVLNDEAAYLWRMASQRNVTESEMLDGLLKNFDISTVLALNDINIFIKTMTRYGILENTD